MLYSLNSFFVYNCKKNNIEDIHYCKKKLLDAINGINLIFLIAKQSTLGTLLSYVFKHHCNYQLICCILFDLSHALSVVLIMLHLRLDIDQCRITFSIFPNQIIKNNVDITIQYNPLMINQKWEFSRIFQ